MCSKYNFFVDRFDIEHVDFDVVCFVWSLQSIEKVSLMRSMKWEIYCIGLVIHMVHSLPFPYKHLSGKLFFLSLFYYFGVCVFLCCSGSDKICRNWRIIKFSEIQKDKRNTRIPCKIQTICLFIEFALNRKLLPFMQVCKEKTKDQSHKMYFLFVSDEYRCFLSLSLSLTGIVVFFSNKTCKNKKLYSNLER